MLLKHTPVKSIERSALTINPAKTCQPVGAMYAALGIKNCLPHSHGSQGCCSYHRSALTRHYKEPVMSATSSFTEGSSVFGGQANLLMAIGNMFEIYNPDVIAIHTTCLSETIGDDIPQIVSKAEAEGKIPKGKFIIHCNTPSYVGSHVVGFSNMVAGMVKYFSLNTGHRTRSVNVIPGFVEPSDMEEIKRLCGELGVANILFPDTSGVLNGPNTGRFHMYPDGGTPVEELIRTGDSVATVGLGRGASQAAVRALDAKCKVPGVTLPLPIGIRATDDFVEWLRQAAGTVVPEVVTKARGQAVDFMTDMGQYFYGKSAALAGDPDHLISLAQFLTDMDITVKHVVTGTPYPGFAEEVKAVAGGQVNVICPGDLFAFHQLIRQDRVDLLFGNTYVKYIARQEDIPLVRTGFPLYDRVGHQYFPIVGYRGALRLLERIQNALMDRIERDAPDESFELVM